MISEDFHGVFHLPSNIRLVFSLGKCKNKIVCKIEEILLAMILLYDLDRYKDVRVLHCNTCGCLNA